MIFDSKPLYAIPEGIETRWASPENWDGAKGVAAQKNGGRKGSACFPFKADETKVLAHAENTSGTVRRIWLTISDRSPEMLRGIRIDMYWDGEDKPAVSAPLGDFFGQSLGRCCTFESALFSNPEGRSFNSNVPMPFQTGMKIVVTNESGKDLEMLFYDVNYTLGDKHESPMYFHAHWRRERPTTLREDYEFLPKVKGKGRFLGLNCGVIADTETYFRTWWGEGECKVFIDGDTEFPTLSGTGTEDYIGTAWGQGQYAHMYQGCPLADDKNMQYAFYRYHIPDPIYFYQEIRVTMQQIGYTGGNDQIQKLIDAGRKITATEGTEMDLEAMVKENRGNIFEREDDWSSCAYFYLDKPSNELSELPAAADRMVGLFNPEDTSKRADQ